VIGKRTTLVLFLALFCVVGSGDTHADDTAAAEATFQRGKAHMAAGRVAEACNDFALSAKLEASTGTFLNLGDCNQKLGKTASAWTWFMKAVSHAADAGLLKMEAYAKKRVAAIKTKLTYAEIRASGTLPNGSVVTRNGDDATLVVGIPVPLDPGEYIFLVKAPGYEDWSTTVRVAGEGKTIVVQLPKFTKGVTQEPPPAKTEETKVVAPPVAPAIDQSAGASKESDLSASAQPGADSDRPLTRKRRTLALRVGGAGLAVVATGLVFGGLARSKLQESNDGCDADNLCSQSAFDLREEGETFANIATVLTGIGAIGVAAGAYFWFTPPKTDSKKSASTIGPLLMPGKNGVGFAISGTY
jgi:hypothetical protein